ncbi:hypothetical protein FHR72_004080 [Mycolicibacterium iranicum]|uniref:DUF732 domain-containing protein n=1 Tax=Mycolicibacterium iranicum TaxID=912594 RepID=A0A839Q948_MYCIR|nr:hypothetical protein [Mycolicibacterium iranicum]MBB2992579.1 hypothetical protein [Mycolicibacterium iranicum]
MRKLLVASLASLSLLFAACGDETPSEQFGFAEVGKSARDRMEANGGMSVQDACQAEVDALSADRLKDLVAAEVVDGCIRANTGDK